VQVPKFKNSADLLPTDLALKSSDVFGFIFINK
jgi:hypothetical protein